MDRATHSKNQAHLLFTEREDEPMIFYSADAEKKDANQTFTFSDENV
jgi:hypothetical protein